MKIVFMGTPDFAVAALKRLYDSDHEVCAVFTQPDKPVGRGFKLKAPPVKELALERGTDVYQPESLKKDPQAAIDILKKYSPEVIVVAAYGKILPSQILEFPKYGCLNIHGSLLPKYRGAAPIQWSVLNGDEVTGVTIMQMAEGIDTGDILLTDQTPIGINETAAELFDRLSVMGAELIVKALDNIKSLKPIAQDEAMASYASMLSKNMCSIDFSKDAFTVHKQICGLSDWPCASTLVRGKRVKVYKSELVSREGVCGKPGELINNESFEIACGEGAVRLSVVQAEGSKRMDAADFLRGRRLDKGEIIGE